MSMRIAILASGSGSNLECILRHAAGGRLDVTPVLAASNIPGCGAMQKAARYGVPVWERSHKGLAREVFDQLMLEALAHHGVELVVLAGYMRLVGPAFISQFSNRIINLHPAILPSFPGVSGSEDAITYGARITGCTVHFVEEAMDGGPVIIQAAVPCLPDDTPDQLMQRIHTMEHRIYPQAIQWLAHGRIRLKGRQAVLSPAASNPARASFLPDTGLLSGGVSTTSPAYHARAAESWLVSPALEDF